MTVTVSSAFRRSPAPPRGFAFQHLDEQLYLLPSGLVSGEAAAAAVIGGLGWPLAEGVMSFTTATVLWREDKVHWAASLPFAQLIDWAESQGEDVARHMGRLVRRIGARRPDWAGLDMSAPVVMGIVNTTPDSFSDGGRHLDPDRAVNAGLEMVQAGAGIIDVGGESTRPGADPVSEDEEIRRTQPVVRELANRGVVVSIDTRHARVMGAAMDAGARIINDITALEGPGSLTVARDSKAAVCLMHMQGTDPRTMQSDPVYDCAPLDVYDYLARRVAVCEAAGLDRAQLCVDPGIGFGKTVDHNAQILASLALYHGLGLPILLGASRKTFVGKLSRGEPPAARLPGTLAAHLAGVDAGAQIIRAHDVAETVQALSVWRGIKAAA